MNTCTAEFLRLSTSIPDVRCDSDPFLTLHSPFTLQNWTMPVIEFVMIAGAAACLLHGIRRYRRTGDASNLVVWMTGVVALLLIEPLAYFPQWFGLEKSMGLTFVHNQFSVQFLFDRLPLYIVAMYPVFGYLAYVLVQRCGIFAKYNALVSAASVAFVFHCFFEVVDTVGPQWKWWVWNTQLSTSVPALGVVPVLNIQAFTLALPFGMVLFTRLICRTPHRGGWWLLRDVLIVSVAVWPIQFLASLPATIYSAMGGSIETARLASVWFYIAATGVTTVTAFVGAYRARRTAPDIVPSDAGRDWFPMAYGLLYLVSAAAFWIGGWSDYVHAHNGVTHSGGQTGSLGYGAVAFVLSLTLLVGAYARTPQRSTPPGKSLHQDPLITESRR